MNNQSIIETQSKSGDECMDFHEYEQLAQSGETNRIERKSIRIFNAGNEENLKQEIGKTISAFSNYLGGCMLIGVSDKGEIEAGISDTYKKTTRKEWLEDLVCAGCSPPITFFSVKKISKDDLYLYAIFIGQSDQAPHQDNNTNKYFSRIDGKSRPIDGIFVRDIFNRVKCADLTVEGFFEKSTEMGNQRVAFLNLMLINKSQIPAEDVLVLMNAGSNVVDGAFSSGAGVFWDERGQGQFSSKLVYPDIRINITSHRKIPFKECVNRELNFTIVAKNMRKKVLSYRIWKHGGGYELCCLL